MKALYPAILISTFALVGCNEEEVNSLKEQKEDLQQKNDELKVQNADQQTQLEELDGKLTTQNAAHDEQINELKGQSEKLQTENANLADQLKAATGKVTELEASLAANTAQKKAAQEVKQGRVEDLIKNFNELQFGRDKFGPPQSLHSLSRYYMLMTDNPEYPIKIWGYSRVGSSRNPSSRGVREVLLDPSTINTYFKTPQAGQWIDLKAKTLVRSLDLKKSHPLDWFFVNPYSEPFKEWSKEEKAEAEEGTHKDLLSGLKTAVPETYNYIKDLSPEELETQIKEARSKRLKELKQDEFEKNRGWVFFVAEDQQQPLIKIFTDLANAYK